MILALLAAATLSSLPDVSKVFGNREGAIVLIDCATGATQRHNPSLSATRLPPCSTFKIWNTAIGLETGILTSADQPFWTWDGVKRSIELWNQDLTLREAHAASCVPAYQALARRIGAERMNEWLKKLDYGDRNTTSGKDVFWLPAPGRTPLLISPDEQARLVVRLANGDLPFSAKTLAVLKDIMTAKTTDHGTLYGKTGTGGGGQRTPAIGWFVGYLISGKNTLAFACVLTGRNATGKEARKLVEQFFLSGGLL
ncbi:MAG: penicillin-binding transpeptidase domain-containing protein [Terrimicrobiaceae bacterium]